MIGPFDLVLTDTSLFQSLTAAIQSKCGKTVLQIDENNYYGGPEGGSFKIDLESSEEKPSTATTFIYDPCPIVFYARGPLTDILLSLGLTDYTEFAAVESQFIWTMPRKLISIPLSKEQVMLEASLSLLEKRKLSKLLNSLSSTEGPQSTTLFDFLASEDIHSESLVFQLIAFGVCRCNSLDEVRKLSISRTIEILQAFKASVMHLDGRAGPFVVPCWGSSELAQAACRRAAVNGSIQMFNKSLSVLQGEEEEIEYKSVFKQQSATAPQTFRSCLLLNSPILGIGGTAIVTIPPNCIDSRCEKVINILQLTSDSKCCPKGTWIIHLWSEGDFDTSEIEHNLLQSSAAVSCTRILWRETRATCNRSFTQPPLPANYQHEADFVDALNRYNSE